MAIDWRAELAKRPGWMNLIFGFCLYMTFLYMPFDLFWKAVEHDEEVWFGFVLTGWWAKATEPLHWLIYGFGAYGFWKMRSWMWPWASVYCAQVTFAMFVYSLTDPRAGTGWISASLLAALFLVPTIALWRAKDRFS